MMDYRNVIVLQDARAVRDNLAQELARRDFAVRSCGSLAGLRHLYAAQPSPLIVLTGESDDLACDAQSARMAAPAAVIIALGTATDAAWRTHVMAAGADACHAASIDIAELTAILLSWGRQAARVCRMKSSDLAVGRRPYRPVDHAESAPRAGPARAALSRALSHVGPHARSHVPSSCSGDIPQPRVSSPGPGQLRHRCDHRDAQDLQHSAPPAYPSGRLGSGWSLDASCRVLICPRDRTLFMTVAENDFLMRVAASEGQLLRRRRPASGDAIEQGRGGADQPLDPRSMDVVVSRLRRKARLADIELPLLAVRGCGYLFAEPLAVRPSSLLSRASMPRDWTSAQLTHKFVPRPDSRARMGAPRLLAA
ncbi:helix-turn-helix domain-containing protein [Bordetella sp. H567]|uniref:helix-turn-helix domain-containing protein n=1 Tax=Bordetella sp. H567 TaxID=1697043 RepID=UPI00082D183C|nr:helix-turn-helix domain-containing protein [Bordetella sp. H567]